MRVEVAAAEDLPGLVADRIAAALQEAVAARGRATLAVSGGRTPGAMLRALADADVPWAQVHVLQVDERVAPAGDAARNLTGLTTALLDRVPLPAGNVCAIPVEWSDATAGGTDPARGPVDPDLAARRYAADLRVLAGEPPVLDVVQLGLGDDGHTASLIPGDPVVEVTDRTVASTGDYQGHRRVTLTRPVLDAARLQVWLATGADKASAVARLVADDPALVASRVRRDAAVLHLDPAAAAALPGPDGKIDATPRRRHS